MLTRLTRYYKRLISLEKVTKEEVRKKEGRCLLKVRECFVRKVSIFILNHSQSAACRM